MSKGNRRGTIRKIKAGESWSQSKQWMWPPAHRQIYQQKNGRPIDLRYLRTTSLYLCLWRHRPVHRILNLKLKQHKVKLIRYIYAYILQERERCHRISPGKLCLLTHKQTTTTTKRNTPQGEGWIRTQSCYNIKCKMSSSQ